MDNILLIQKREIVHRTASDAAYAFIAALPFEFDELIEQKIVTIDDILNSFETVLAISTGLLPKD